MSDTDRLDELEGRINALTDVNAMLLKAIYSSPDARNRVLRRLGAWSGQEFVERSAVYRNGYTQTLGELVKRAYGARLQSVVKN